MSEGAGRGWKSRRGEGLPACGPPLLIVSAAWPPGSVSSRRNAATPQAPDLKGCRSKRLDGVSMSPSQMQPWPKLEGRRGKRPRGPRPGSLGGSAPEETARCAGRSDTPRGAAPASGPRTRSGVSPAGEVLRRERERAEETGRGSCCDGGNREQRARGRGQAVRVNISRGDIRETLVGVFLRLAFTVRWGDSSPAS